MDRRIFLILGLAGLVAGTGCRRVVESLFPANFTVQYVVFYPSLGEVEARVRVDGDVELTQLALMFPADTFVFDTSLSLTADGSPYRIAFPASALPDTAVQAVFTYTSAGETSTAVWSGTLAWVNATAAMLGRMVLPESTYYYVIWSRAFAAGRLSGEVRLSRGMSIRLIWTDRDGLSAYRNGEPPARVFLDTTFSALLDLDRTLPDGVDTFVTLLEYTAPDTAYADARLLQIPQ